MSAQPNREDDWNDLRERLQNASAQLTELAVAERGDSDRRRRLAGKVAGVRLALDYMRGYE